MDEGQRLQEFLLQNWSAGLRLTTIPQAMQRLRIQDDPHLRWRTGERLEALWRGALTSPERQQKIAAALGRSAEEGQLERFRQQVDTWNMASVVLSEDEKLVARYILLCRHDDLPLPQPAETARALGLTVPEVHSALRMLARVGFLSIPDGRRPAEYTLGDGYKPFLEGLGFNFHTVTLNMGERFGVP